MSGSCKRPISQISQISQILVATKLRPCDDFLILHRRAKSTKEKEKHETAIFLWGENNPLTVNTDLRKQRKKHPFCKSDFNNSISLLQ